MKWLQRGGFVLGAVIGLLIGLALALGVALYITKAPIPFVNKVPNRTAEQDKAEEARNKNWDPNAPLAVKNPPRAASAPAAEAASAPVAAASAPVAASAPRSARDPAAILAGGTPGAAAPKAPPPGLEPFVYFVQAGAYTHSDEAEQQRAKLGLLGLTAKITEREQAGRVVYRVRVGPFDTRGEAETLQSRLQETQIESQLVRVDRP